MLPNSFVLLLLYYWLRWDFVLFTMLTKSATNILYNFDTVLTLRHMLKSVLNHFLSYIEKGQWYLFLQINVRENRRDKQEWTIQRMRQQWVHYNPDNAATVGTQIQLCIHCCRIFWIVHSCWVLILKKTTAKTKSTTQYVLDITTHKQTQIT